MASSGYFVTGTDTNVGKTWASVALMLALQARGWVVAGMKPVSAGCQWQQGGWKNQDALLLQRYASLAFDYHRVNPYAFERPISPHIACGDAQVSLEVILAEFNHLKVSSDCVVVEGAGGWLSPLGPDIDNEQLAVALGLPVIVVVGMRLGCINHARLTVQAIRRAGLPMAGWLAVQLESDMPEFPSNLAYLQNRLGAPCLGVLPHMTSSSFLALASFVNI